MCARRVLRVLYVCSHASGIVLALRERVVVVFFFARLFFPSSVVSHTRAPPGYVCSRKDNKKDAKAARKAKSEHEAKVLAEAEEIA